MKFKNFGSQNMKIFTGWVAIPIGFTGLTYSWLEITIGSTYFCID